jgi:hypothetical protein
MKTISTRHGTRFGKIGHDRNLAALRKHGGVDLGQRRALALAPPPASPPQPASTSPLDPLDATARWHLPDLIVFVYGVMLARRYVTLLGAAGGVGKSASIAATAVCCALGRALLGEGVS